MIKYRTFTLKLAVEEECSGFQERLVKLIRRIHPSPNLSLDPFLGPGHQLFQICRVDLSDEMKVDDRRIDPTCEIAGEVDLLHISQGVDDLIENAIDTEGLHQDLMDLFV